MVDLSGNDITELPPSLFLTQLNLLLIDLSRNKIMKTPYSSFNRRVGTVLLQGNSLILFLFQLFAFLSSIEVKDL